jgi:hypothetical protein
MSDCMSGSDVSREYEELDESQFSDADDEAVEVRVKSDSDTESSCKAEMNFERHFGRQSRICFFGYTMTNMIADGLA